MPIYEYFCGRRRRPISILVRNITGRSGVKCERCGNSDLQRLMSRFSAVRPEESRLESLADPGQWSGLDENNSASMAKFVRKMGGEMRADIPREEIDQMAEEAAGE